MSVFFFQYDPLLFASQQGSLRSETVILMKQTLEAWCNVKEYLMRKK
jgi:hypothetical protein